MKLDTLRIIIGLCLAFAGSGWTQSDAPLGELDEPAPGNAIGAQADERLQLPITTPTESPGHYTFDSWWDGEFLTGDWGGLRSDLADSGVAPFAFYNAIIAGNPVGGKKADFSYADDFYFGVKLDLEKLVGWQGASFSVTGVNRDGQSIQPSLGSQYDVMQLVGGQAVFLYGLFLEQRLFDDKLSVKLGHLGASDDFAASPLYGYYLNNGIDGNIRAVLFDTRFSAYPFASWGARVRVDPTPELNVMAGVYQVSERMFDRNYHGVDFSIRDGDGMLMLAQVGWTPEFFKQSVPVESGPSDGKGVKAAMEEELAGYPGHYFVGGYWSAWDYPQFGKAETTPGTYGFYAHGDQTVFLESPGDDQGLQLFTTFTLAPQENVAIIPFQVNGGAIYTGLVPTRDQDATILGVIYGQFSDDYAQTVVDAGGGEPDYELVFEAGYRLQVTDFAYIQPDIQYVIQPGGTGEIPNALVIGAQFGVKF